MLLVTRRMLKRSLQPPGTLSIIAFLLIGLPAFGAERTVEEIIGDYVALGLRDNLALRSESLTVEQASAALRAARAQFLPELGVAARYTRAHGGRAIDIPTGTVINPVYSTLNELLSRQGQPANFPQIQDEQINFQREREQETRLTARQLLYAPGIAANVRALDALYQASQSERVALARELKRDITVSYLSWLMAHGRRDIVAAGHVLLQENLRVNESLSANGKITEDRVLRARAELLNVEQQLRDARDGVSQTRSYCNFLLNRPLEAELEYSDLAAAIEHPAADIPSLQSEALINRPELTQLAHTVEAAQQQVNAARASLLPVLSLGIDAGIQGENYGVGPNFNFVTASLVFTWKIYSGGGVNAQIDSARAAAQRAELRRSAAAQRVALEVEQTVDRYRTAEASLATATARVEAAEAAFRIARRKRDEGMLNQVEFLDARVEFTDAELNLNVSRFDVRVRRAELDFATANGPVPIP